MIQFNRLESEEKWQVEDAAWESLIGQSLCEWERDPSRLEDDGIDPPSQIAIAAAQRQAHLRRSERVRAPTRVIPTGDGGVAIQWDDEEDLTSLEVQADGGVELFKFHNGHLVSRLPLNVPSNDG